MERGRYRCPEFDQWLEPESPMFRTVYTSPNPTGCKAMGVTCAIVGPFTKESGERLDGVRFLFVGLGGLGSGRSDNNETTWHYHKEAWGAEHRR